MSYKATAYLYLLFNSEIEGEQKSQKLYEAIKLEFEKKAKKNKCDLFSLSKRELTLYCENFSESWCFWDKSFGVFKVVDLELSYIDADNNYCTEKMQDFLIQLLEEKIIDSFSVTQKKNKVGVFSFIKSHDEIYMGYQTSLIFLFKQMINITKLSKHEKDLSITLNKFWDDISKDQDILTINKRHKKTYFKNNNSKVLSEINKFMR